MTKEAMQISAENRVFSRSHTESIYTHSEKKKNPTRLPLPITNNIRWKVYQKKMKGFNTTKYVKYTTGKFHNMWQRKISKT